MAKALEKKWQVHTGDVETAFLNAWLDPDEPPIYLIPPTETGKSDELWFAQKWTYGLRKSPKGLNKFIARAVKTKQWERITGEPQLFHNHRFPGALMSVHTDDLLLTADPKDVAKIKAELGSLMSIRWEGAFGNEWKKFFGFEWKHVNDEITCRVPLSYYENMLSDWKMEKCKPALNPFSPAMLHPPEDSRDVDEQTHSRYRRTVGQLLWILPARPTLAHTIKELYRGNSAPKTYHVIGLKRTLKYIQRTKHNILVLKYDGPTGLRVWADSDWRAPRSTTGGLHRWNGVLLESASKTQSIPALSSGEAELISMSDDGKEGRFLQQILEEIEGHEVPILLYCDSSAAIGSAKRMGVGKIRHLELRELWIQEQVAQKKLQVEKIQSSDNDADILTKQIKGQQLFEMLCERLGERQNDGEADEQNHVREDDETETESCVNEIDKNEWWRKRLKQAMYECGYGEGYAGDFVDQLQTEADGTVILSQLAVVTACGRP